MSNAIGPRGRSDLSPWCRDPGARRGRISVVSLVMDRNTTNERLTNWLRWLTRPGSPGQDMVAGYQLIAIVALEWDGSLAVLWDRL